MYDIQFVYQIVALRNVVARLGFFDLITIVEMLHDWVLGNCFVICRPSCRFFSDAKVLLYVHVLCDTSERPA